MDAQMLTTLTAAYNRWTIFQLDGGGGMWDVISLKMCIDKKSNGFCVDFVFFLLVRGGKGRKKTLKHACWVIFHDHDAMMHVLKIIIITVLLSVQLFHIETRSLILELDLIRSSVAYVTTPLFMDVDLPPLSGCSNGVKPWSYFKMCQRGINNWKALKQTQ